MVRWVENLLLRISGTPTSQAVREEPDHHNGKGEDDNLSNDARPHVGDNHGRGSDGCGAGERAKQSAGSAHEHREKSGNEKAYSHLWVNAHYRRHHRAGNARQRRTDCESSSVKQAGVDTE